MPKPAALARLARAHDLDERAAENLLRYLDDQRQAAGVIPDNRTLLVERIRDELGDWRICVLSPFGGRVHAPWAMAVEAKFRRERGIDLESIRTWRRAGGFRRGLFAAEIRAMQFALPPAVDLLRSLRDDPEQPEVVALAAADPANACGAALRWPALRWPALEGAPSGRLARAAGAHVVLVNGALAAHVGRGGRQLTAFLPADEPERSRFARAVASALARLAQGSRAGFELDAIDGAPPRAHPLAPYLSDAGFWRARAASIGCGALGSRPRRARRRARRRRRAAARGCTDLMLP